MTLATPFTRHKIFLDISQVIISHDIVINRNAAPLSVPCGRTALIFSDNLSFLAGQVLLAMKETKVTKVALLMEVQGTIR